MTSLSLPTNVLVRYHVIQDTVAGSGILQSLLAHTQVQLQPLLLQLERFLFLLVNVQSSHHTLVLHNLHL